jgi:hypothetical protein
MEFHLLFLVDERRASCARNSWMKKQSYKRTEMKKLKEEKQREGLTCVG